MNSWLTKTKAITKQVLCGSQYYRVLRLASGVRKPGARLSILVYHNLCRAEDLYNGSKPYFRVRPQLTTTAFAKHMEVVHDTYPVVSLTDGVDALRQGTLETDTVAITFDDGYRSFKTLAFPILQSFELPATVFLTTDYVNENRYYWWDELNQLAYQLLDVKVDAGLLSQALGPRLSHEWLRAKPNPDPARSVLGAIESSFRYIPRHERAMRMDILRELLPEERRAQLCPEGILSWDEIRTLSPHGVDWGSHTCSHIGFGEEDAGTIETELAVSRRIIESQTGRSIVTFAYPYGADGPSYARSTRLLKDTGYTYARTMLRGFNDRSTDPLLLHGSGISSESESPLLILRDLQLSFVRRTTV